MTADALAATRRELQHCDLHRDRYERRDRVQRLARLGMSKGEIATIVGIHERQVERDRKTPPPPQRPRLYNAQLADNERIRDLEKRAELALQLTTLLRDEDPAIVWGTLTRLTRRQLQELAVIALAAIPVDLTRDQLLGWVAELPGIDA